MVIAPGAPREPAGEAGLKGKLPWRGHPGQRVVAVARGIGYESPMHCPPVPESESLAASLVPTPGRNANPNRGRVDFPWSARAARLACALVAGAMALAVLVPATVARATNDPERWREQVEGYQAEDEARGQAVEPGGVVFTGSSTIRRWDTAAAFPELPHVNRAIGGSQLPDVLFWGEQLILPYQPALIVLYSGSNDVNAGVDADGVVARYLELAAWIDEHLPETRLLFITIKPTTARWDKWPVMQEINRRITEDAAAHERRFVIDVTAAMMNEDGEPEQEYLVADGLHLSDKGYEKLAAAVGPAIQRLLR